MALRSFLLMITAAILATLAMAVWLYPVNEDFHTENPMWNGTRHIATDFPVSSLKSLRDITGQPGRTLILVPYLDFTGEELQHLELFISEGGTLIIADDYGYGNRVLERLGLTARFSGKALLDPLVYHVNSWFPRIVHFRPDVLTADIKALVFNHATVLSGVKDDEVIAFSSAFSFLDDSGNEKWVEGEASGPLPVMSRHRVNGGEVVLIADPSIFINSMVNIADNGILLRNIADGSTELFIDQSHLPASNLSLARSALTRVRGLLVTPLGILLLISTILALTMLPLFRAGQSPGVERR